MSFFFFISFSFGFLLFYKNYFIIIFFIFFFKEHFFYFFMFRDVLECSGMFRNVPCSGFYRRPGARAKLLFCL